MDIGKQLRIFETQNHWDPQNRNDHQDQNSASGKEIIITFNYDESIICFYLPTIISSRSDAFFLMSFQISIVKIVDAELKMEVNEDIKAANITANIKPRRPNIIT